MTELPSGLHEFLAQSGWGDAELHPIPGDASFRRYFRLKRSDAAGAMLMHAPPPEEDPVPFLDVADWLTRNGMRAPEILASDAPSGWVLTEDFGDDRMRDWLDLNPQGEQGAYEDAIDALVGLHQLAPGPFAAYDMATYQRETDLLPEWYCPAHDLQVDIDGYRRAWNEVLGPVCARQNPGVTVLRDYHAENIMLLGDPERREGQGLIDFQDALVGHPAYDLVSLLQDARRDVSPSLESAMLARYQDRAQPGPDFLADYACLGAQRNAKIVGIFSRLNKRDGKPRYLALIPRVWQAMERDLEHPVLAPVARWFDANIPADLRAAHGGVIE